jgi:hypothetical protein
MKLRRQERRDTQKTAQEDKELVSQGRQRRRQDKQGKKEQETYSNPKTRQRNRFRQNHEKDEKVCMSFGCGSSIKSGQQGCVTVLTTLVINSVYSFSSSLDLEFLT